MWYQKHAGVSLLLMTFRHSWGKDSSHLYHASSVGVVQIDFILGDCCGGVNPDTGKGKFSYIVGMGDSYPKYDPHEHT
jgi:hypothetical protein